MNLSVISGTIILVMWLRQSVALPSFRVANESLKELIASLRLSLSTLPMLKMNSGRCFTAAALGVSFVSGWAQISLHVKIRQLCELIK